LSGDDLDVLVNKILSGENQPRSQKRTFVKVANVKDLVPEVTDVPTPDPVVELTPTEIDAIIARLEAETTVVEPVPGENEPTTDETIQAIIAALEGEVAEIIEITPPVEANAGETLNEIIDAIIARLENGDALEAQEPLVEPNAGETNIEVIIAGLEAGDALEAQQPLVEPNAGETITQLVDAILAGLETGDALEAQQPLVEPNAGETITQIIDAIIAGLENGDALEAQQPLVEPNAGETNFEVLVAGLEAGDALEAQQPLVEPNAGETINQLVDAVIAKAADALDENLIDPAEVLTDDVIRQLIAQITEDVVPTLPEDVRTAPLADDTLAAVIAELEAGVPGTGVDAVVEPATDAVPTNLEAEMKAALEDVLANLGVAPATPTTVKLSKHKIVKKI